MNYQWYPGHMTKAIRMMQENIKLIDIIIELTDARIPASSRNPDIDELGKNKYRLIILNKADLADPNLLPLWEKALKGEKENIQFVAHTGDVVDGFSPFMWGNAAEALVPILEVLPGMVVSGNHDISKSGSQYYFLQQPYAQMVQKEGQIFQDGSAAYVTFRAAGMDFLVFGVGYEVVCTDWMNEVISEHPDHVVITVLHKGLQETGAFTKETRAIFLDVMPGCPNFRLILCGHQRGSMTRTEWFDDDGNGEPERSVTIMMYNFQDDRMKGKGFLRLLRFDPMSRNIEVSTYSPWFDQWGYEKATEEENHFVLENAW